MGRGLNEESLRGNWEWLEFAANLPANPQAFTGVTGNQLIYSGRCILTGAAIVNAASTAGTVQLLDGQDATGTPIQVAAVAASSVATIDAPGQGILCEIGVFMVVTTATVKGSVLLIPLAHYDFTPPGT